MDTGHTELPNTYHQGYCYLDVLTGLFWVDINDTSGSEKRIALNAHSANQSVNAVLPTIDTTTGLHNVEPIYSTYVRSIGPGTTKGTIIANRYSGDKDTISIPGLKALAFVDSVSGLYTPTGSNAPSNVTITPAIGTVYSMRTEGNVAAGSAAALVTDYDSNTQTLTYTFTANTPTAVTLPARQEVNVMTGVESAVAAAQTFTGDQAAIVLTAAEGGYSDGDAVSF